MPFTLRARTYSPFVRRQRAAARKALYGSLALMALPAIVLGAIGLRRLRRFPVV